MTLFDLWKKAEKELESAPELYEKILRKKLFCLSGKWPYTYAVPQKFPNIIKFINYAARHPFSPRLLQEYLNRKTQHNWHLSIEYFDGAPANEYFLAHKMCHGKKNGISAFENIKQFLDKTTTMRINYGCTAEGNTKMEFSLDSILMKPGKPVNGIHSDRHFNLYEWVVGGPVIDGKNIWANCINDQSALILKEAICDHMKHVKLVPVNENSKEK